MAITKFRWGMGGTDESSGFGKKVWFKRPTDPADVEEFATRESSEEQVRKDYQNLFNQLQWYLNEKLTAEIEQYVKQQISDSGWLLSLPDGAVTASKLADNSVTARTVADNAIETNNLADNSVTGAKLADGSVSGVKLTADSVTGDKLADGTVTQDKLDANACVTGNGEIISADNGKKYKAVLGEEAFRYRGDDAYYRIALSDVDVDIGTSTQKVTNRATGVVTTYTNAFDYSSNSAAAYYINDDLVLIKSGNYARFWRPRENVSCDWVTSLNIVRIKGDNLYLAGKHNVNYFDGSTRHEFVIYCYDVNTLQFKRVFGNKYYYTVEVPSNLTVQYIDDDRVICSESDWSGSLRAFDITTGSMQTNIGSMPTDATGYLFTDPENRAVYYQVRTAVTQNVYRYPIAKMSMDTFAVTVIDVPSDFGTLVYLGHISENVVVFYDQTNRHLIKFDMSAKTLLLKSEYMVSLGWQADNTPHLGHAYRYYCGDYLTTFPAYKSGNLEKVESYKGTYRTATTTYGYAYAELLIDYGLCRYGDKYVQAYNQNMATSTPKKTFDPHTDICRKLLYYVEA